MDSCYGYVTDRKLQFIHNIFRLKRTVQRAAPPATIKNRTPNFSFDYIFVIRYRAWNKRNSFHFLLSQRTEEKEEEEEAKEKLVLEIYKIRFKFEANFPTSYFRLHC